MVLPEETRGGGSSGARPLSLSLSLSPFREAIVIAETFSSPAPAPCLMDQPPLPRHPPTLCPSLRRLRIISGTGEGLCLRIALRLSRYTSQGAAIEARFWCTGILSVNFFRLEDEEFLRGSRWEYLDHVRGL